jgi:2-polyprenyl-6-methoxyphenol hydroxylase-like FAD-dependent oxidoreductase
VAADGIYSLLRSRLGIEGRVDTLPTTINRYLISSKLLPAQPEHVEHWGPNRRIGLAPAGPEWTYIYQVCSSKDKVGVRTPIDVDSWSESLPRLRHAFELFAKSEVIQREYQVVRISSWSKGKVALIGDAATGLPPTLGQGAGLAIMNARGLVAALNHAATIEEGLQHWEKSIRFISDRTQAWACRFDVFANRWPDSLWFLRWPVVWSFRSFPVFNHRMRIAERGLSTTELGRAS